MAASETARLLASLELKDLFTKQIDSATKSLNKFDKSVDHSQSRAYKAGTQIGTGIKRGAAVAVGAFGLLAANVALGVHSLEEVEKVTTQTNAVLRSTKGAAGQTAQGIRDMANQFESLNATMDDTVIQSGANVLLTFTNIREKAFKPALQAALDLSTAMGQDLQTSVVQIGKALNDPIKGLTSLTRVGVTFSAKQKEQIKDLVKANDTYGAQRVILAELNREFAGSFIGQGQTTAGKFAKVRDAVDDLQRSLATALLPALSKIADAVSRTLADPAVIATVQHLGESIAGLFSDENLAKGAGAVQGFIKTAVAAAPILEASAKATLSIVEAAVGVFNTLPDPIKALAVGGFALNKLTGGLVTNIGGALIDLIGKSRGASPANPVFVADVSGGLGGAAGAGGIAGTLRSLVTKLGGLALGAGGLAAIGAGTGMGGPAGAGVAAGGAAATIAGGALIAGPLGAIAGSLAAVGKTLIDIRDQSAHQGDDIASSIQAQVAGGASIADLRKSLDAVDQGINDIQANPLNVLVAGDALDQLRAQHDLLTKQIAAIDDTNKNIENAGAILDRGGKATIDAITYQTAQNRDGAGFIARNLLASGRELRTAIKDLARQTNPKKIAADLANINQTLINAGKGNLQTARDAAASIRRALKNTHDPATQSALRAALKAVEGKIPGREYATRQIAKADSILRSSRTVEDKIKGLQAIENDLKNHKLPGQTRALQSKIDALKASQAAAAGKTTQAIKDKDLSVTVPVSVTTTAKIDSKVISREVRRFEKLYSSAGPGK